MLGNSCRFPGFSKKRAGGFGIGVPQHISDARLRSRPERLIVKAPGIGGKRKQKRLRILAALAIDSLGFEIFCRSALYRSYILLSTGFGLSIDTTSEETEQTECCRNGQVKMHDTPPRCFRRPIVCKVPIRFT